MTTFDAALAKLAAGMVDAMHAAVGIGLAAQQVGEARQVCVVDLRIREEAPFSWRLDGAKPPLDLFMPMVLVNPSIRVDPATPEEIVEEGCLSFPQIRGDVIRPDAITVRFQDEKGVPHELWCDGLLSRCIQHEYDHLQGVLFIDRMTKDGRAKIADALKALSKATKAGAA